MDKSKRYWILDSNTGTFVAFSEVLPTEEKPLKDLNNEYVQLYCSNNLALQKSMSPTAKLIFIYMANEMKPGGWFDDTMAHMSKKVGISQNNLYKYLAQIYAAGYAFPGVHKGHRSWRVNPLYAHKGNLFMRDVIVKRLLLEGSRRQIVDKDTGEVTEGLDAVGRELQEVAK
jgi:hypothetical protein